MAYALVTNGAAASSDGNSATTGSLNTTGADLIVVGACSFQGVAVSVSDSKSNTPWNARTIYAVSGDPSVQLFYFQAPTVGTGHTFTVTTSGGFPSVFAAAFSGSTSTPYDVENGSTSGVAVTSKQPGSITPNQDNSLIVSLVAPSPYASNGAIDSSFTITNHVSNGANNYGGAMAYLIQGTAAAVNPTWTFSSATVAVTQAAFKPAVGGGGGSATSDDFMIQAKDFNTGSRGWLNAKIGRAHV